MRSATEAFTKLLEKRRARLVVRYGDDPAIQVLPIWTTFIEHVAILAEDCPDPERRQAFLEAAADLWVQLAQGLWVPAP